MMDVRVSWFVTVAVLCAVICAVHAQGFSCTNWDTYSSAQFADFATYPNIIGNNGRKCTITRGGPTAFCNYYVKYDIDRNSYNNWKGLSWGGVANIGGSGCCNSISGCSTLLGAASWLKSQHKQYCCEPICQNWYRYSLSQFAALATYPNIIGENRRKCTIARGGPTTACNYYVKYDIDRNGYNNWKGLSWGGVANIGGTGCCNSVSGCSNIIGAASWLKSRHRTYCCGR